MADDFVTNAASGGRTFAADDIGGVLYPRGKTGYGSDGEHVEVDQSNPLPVATVPEAAKTTHVVSTAVAPGGSVSLDSDQLTASTTGLLKAVWATASVWLKAEIYTVQNGVASAVLATLFPNPGSDPYKVPYGYISVAHDAGAGFDGFRVQLTNLDPELTADLYVTFFFDEQV